MLHDLLKVVELTYLVPALVRDLDVLATHEHHVADVEEVDPVQAVLAP